MLHDIGMAVDYDDHHKHSRYLILNAGLPGFTPARDGADRPDGALPPQGHAVARRPRAARRATATRSCSSAARPCCGSPSSSSARATRSCTGPTSRCMNGSVRLRLHADEDVTVARWAAERQSDLFERAFGRELDVAE